MTDLAILVPVLRRPEHVAPLLASIDATTPAPFRVVFVADPDDLDEQRAIPRRDDVTLMLYVGGYAAKINAAARASAETLLFLGADDLRFRPGWLDACLAELGADRHVIGVNDLIKRTRPGRERHATHFLITRAYAEQPTVDGGRGPLHEGYTHNYVDDELIATATARGVYAYAADAEVEHLHPMAGAPDDDTYRKGRASFRADRQVFRQRSALWAT